MARKTKKHLVQAFVQSSGVTAAAIVLVFVSLGTVMVPGIFADAATPSISNVNATPSNGLNYSIKVTWSGTTRNNWKGQTIRDGTVIANWNSGDRQYTGSNLQCGVRHTFRVAAAGPNNGAQSDWKSASASTACPTAQVTRIGTTGNTVNLAWRDMSGFSQSYTVYIETNGGGYGAAGSTAATQFNYNGACNTTYNVRLRASANGQTGPYTAVHSIKTPACPSAPSGGGGAPSGGGGTPSGGSAGGSTSGGTRSSTSGQSSRSSGGQPAPAALGNPANFSADIASHKVVVLTWDAAANADHYLISRSTDGATWQEIANTKLTAYNDEGAAFSTTYYYQLQAVGADGKKSEILRAQVTTEAFESSSDTVTSQDKLVTAKIPEGAIEGNYSCTITMAEDDAVDAPDGLSTLLGPYDLLCVTEEGDVVRDFDKAVQLTMKLASVSAGYENISVQTVSDGKWKAANAKYDEESQQATFAMTEAVSFSAFGEKQRSLIGIIMLIFFVLLLIGAVVAGFLWWRRRTPAEQAAARSELRAEQEFQHALAQPDCNHLSMAQQVIPSSAGCYECEQQHTHWTALRICLTCGHVGCSDDSPQQHALKHYHETGHPLIYEYGNPNGNTIGWCYIDQTYV
ncbi:MAG TPA: UBP-type zinc finger domain-containing protein [Candidatus Saccharimonadales bacterium]